LENGRENSSAVLPESAIAGNYANVRARRENARVISENDREKNLTVLPANYIVLQILSAILVRNSAIAQNYSNARAPSENVREKSSTVSEDRGDSQAWILTGRIRTTKRLKPDIVTPEHLITALVKTVPTRFDLPE
jgi:hypothetical protein